MAHVRLVFAFKMQYNLRMKKPISLVGQRFGRLVVMRRAEDDRPGVVWLCTCDCGKDHLVAASSLKAGQKSCGCLRDEKVSARSTKHGHTKDGNRSREYDSWASARERTKPSSAKKFPNYAGRGIKMCARWASSFQSFIDDMGKCPENFTLERDDVDGDYEPGNCRWVSRHEQARNRRTNVLVEWNGAQMVLKDVAICEGISYSKLHRAFRYKNMELKDAVAYAKVVK